MTYIYIRTHGEDQLWTVGERVTPGTGYGPTRDFLPESDHATPEEAADRVILLNGGTPPGRTPKADAQAVKPLLLARAESYASDARKFRHEPLASQMAESTYWARVYEAVASELRKIAEPLSGGTDVAGLIGKALTTDGAHHKQWYLEKLAVALGVDMPQDREEGIAP